MSEGQDQSKGFYEAKGMVRQTVILTEGHKERLKQLAKLHNVTQGEVIEVLLDYTDFEMFADKFKAKKAVKSEGKLTKGDLLKKMTNLTPEQLAAIAAIVSKGQQ